MKRATFIGTIPRAAQAKRQIALGIAALALGAIGEALLFTRPRWLGAILLVCAAAIGAVAWARVGPQATDDRPPTTDHHLAADDSTPAERGVIHSRSNAWRLGGVVLALAIAVAGMLAWATDPGAIFGWQGVLWLASVALFVASCAGMHISDERAGPVGPSWTRLEIATLAGVTALALLTHLLWLNDVPWRFQYDEVIARIESMPFYQGPATALFSTTWYGTSVPTLPFAFTGALMHLVGTGLGGTRFGVALVAALMVVPLYGLARLLFGWTVALLAGIGWATTAAAIHYSRISLLDIAGGLGYLCCFYFLLRGLRSGKIADFAYSGLSAGLSMYLFYNTRLLPFLLVAFCAYLLVFHREEIRGRLLHFAMLPVGYIVGFGPLLAYFIANPGMWASRGLSELSVHQLFPASLAGWVENAKTLSLIAWQDFLGLSVIRENSSTYWAPLLFPAEAVLLVLGVGVLARRWREPGAFLVTLWGAAVMIAGGVLIAGNRAPAFVIWTPAFPVFFIAIALPPALLLESLGNVSPRWRAAGGFIVGVWIAGLALANIYTYLATYPAKVPTAFETSQGRYLATLALQDRVRFVGDSSEPYFPAIGAMMSPGVPASQLFNPSRSLPPPGDPQHDLIFVFDSDEVQYLPLVQSYYPGGKTEVMDTAGGPLARRYVVSEAQAMSRYGVTLELANGKDETWQGRVETVGALSAQPITLTYPLTATWSGELFVQSSGQISLQVEERAGATLLLNGEPQAPGQAISVDSGWIPFVLTARLAKASPLHLLLQTGSGTLTEVPTTHLWPSTRGAGLAATFNGVSVHHRIDPFVGAGVMAGTSDITPTDVFSSFAQRDPDLLPLVPTTAGPARIRWEGEVLTQDGVYTMELRTDAHALLSIDGHVVLNLCANPPVSPYVPIKGGIPPATARIELTSGWHKVRLDFEATGNINGIEWAWTRPDGVREIVPPSSLRYREGGGFSWPDLPPPVACPR